jgi:carbon storage regulator CsrA
MLVLTRKQRQSIVVGRTSGFEQLLKITVIESRAGKVWLGFEAGAEVAIHREEVWERICTERQTKVAMEVLEKQKYRVPYIE